MAQQSVDVKQKINDELTNALRNVHETRDMGAETLQELYRQGDALKRVNRNLDATNEALTEGERHIRTMERGMLNLGADSANMKNEFDAGLQVTDEEFVVERKVKLFFRKNTIRLSGGSFSRSVPHRI